MKVCMINAHDSAGGAAIAARRLKQALKADLGVSIDQVARFSSVPEESFTRLSSDGNSGDSTRMKQYPFGKDGSVALLFDHMIKSHRTEMTKTIFTSDVPGWDISMLPEIRNADVINLHWVSKFLNTESLLRLHRLGKPIVWTLHDQRAYTGGCHYTAGCECFTAGCDSCPQLDEVMHWLPPWQLRTAVEALSSAPLTFVAPSRWMEKELRRSHLFQSGKHKVKTIPYSLDTDCFCPVGLVDEKRRLRRQFGLPEDAVCIVVGSRNWSDERKGGIHLLQSLQKLGSAQDGYSEQAPICVVVYGKKARFDLSLPVHNVGFLRGEKDMADLLRCCDLYVTMALEDNLPSSVMEALACGLPVLATAVGGVPDMVEDRDNGRLVPSGDVEAMALAIKGAVESPDIRKRWARRARERVVRDYSPEVQAAAYCDLFASLIKEQPKQKLVSSLKFSAGDFRPALVYSLPVVPCQAMELAADVWKAGKNAKGKKANRMIGRITPRFLNFVSYFRKLWKRLARRV